MVTSKINPYDIFSPEALRNPLLYEQMRIHGAIHPQTGQTFSFLTRYDGCLNFLRDTRFGKEFHYHAAASNALRVVRLGLA